MKGLPRFVGLICVALALVTPVPVAAAPAGGDAPDSFNVDISATPLYVEISAPAALPLDVNAGIAFSRVGLNSQPRVQSSAGPVYVPLLSDVGLLGGPAGVLATGIRLGPGLVIGIPTLFGLDPLPVDPSLVDVGPVANRVGALPLPPFPPLSCTSYYPDVPNDVACGGPIQDFFGLRLRAGSARTTSTGKDGDPASLSSRSDARVTGISSTPENTLAPLSVAGVASAAESHIANGRITAAASAQATQLTAAGALVVSSVNASFAAAMGGTSATLQQSPLHCEIGAVSLLGQPFVLNEEGVTLGSSEIPANPIGAILDPLQPVIGGLGGKYGNADFGSVTITPYPKPTSDVSADGTQITHRFGCLEIRYRNVTSGTDVKFTVGTVAVTMSAFQDTPVLETGGATSDIASSVGPFGTTTPDVGRGDFALPSIPVPGSKAPTPSEHSFVQSISTSNLSWGLDGTWFARYALLALATPVLVRYRRLAPLRRSVRS